MGFFRLGWVTRRRRFVTLMLATIAAGVLAVAFVVAFKIEAIRWRAVVVARQATGSIKDVSWSDLLFMLRPGSEVYLTPLADNANPYTSIRVNVTSEQTELGRAIFEGRCASCHESNGDGITGPPLVGRGLEHGDSDWAMYRVIRNGVPETAMAAQQLSRKETWQIIAYLRELGAKADASTNLPRPKVDVKEVTYQRLALSDTEAGKDGWLTYSGTYNGQRFSSLDQVDRSNVSRLRVKWIRLITDIGSGRVETTPIVNGSTMFVTAPPSKVLALSTDSGEVLWEFSRKLPSNVRVCCWVTNRGVAVLGNSVYVGTADAHLLALDSATGKVKWDVEVADNSQGYSITSAPLAIDGLVVTGISGGDYATRGFIDAYDSDTGKRRWRFFTIPGPGELGNETWSGNSWQTGGAATWLTGSFDSKQELVFWGVGNAAPDFVADERAGDNLYSNSVVALHAKTGSLAWHFQFTPNDDHDWDSNQVPVLADIRSASGVVPALLWANRNGFFYTLNRVTGQFLRAKPFVRQTWADTFDDKGRPIKNINTSPSRKGTLVYPGAIGATNWWSPTFSPKTGLMYVPTTERGSIFFSSGMPKAVSGELYLGSRDQAITADVPKWTVKALDPGTGEVIWQYRDSRKAATMTGLLSTGGNLLFVANRTDLLALDAESGQCLWHFDTGEFITAAPITFMSGGQQQVIIAAGQLLLDFELPSD